MAEGWAINHTIQASSDATVGSATVSSSTAGHGSHSLAVTFNGDGASKYTLWLSVSLCGNGSSAAANLSGRSFAFRVRLEGDQLPAAAAQGSVYWGGAPGFEPGFHDVVYGAAGSWEDYSVRLDDVNVNSSNNITITIAITMPWSGIIYFDQMQIL
jgi:hypothetical protein